MSTDAASVRNQAHQALSEAKLRDAWRQLNESQRIAKLGSWELDLVSGALFWSDEIFRIFEVDPGGFGATYETFLNAIHPDDREAVDRAYRTSLANKASYEITHRLRMEDGRIKWVHERCETEFDTDGTPLRSRGTVQDITERKRADDSLRQLEAMLATFLKVAPEAVILTNERGRINVFNAGAEAIFGHAASEVVGRSIGCLLPERFREAHRGHVREFARSPVPSRMMNQRAEIAGLRKNGEEFPAEAALSKLTTPNGIFFAVMLRDITPQKAAREDLIKAKVAAEAALEAKSCFIANMSHELRTPLNAIIGFSEVLLAPRSYSLDDAKMRDYAKDIHSSGHHLLTIINDILDFSGMEFGKIKRIDEPIAVMELIQAAIRMVDLKASEGEIAVLTEVAPDLPELLVDRRLLLQALLNLLSNAIKFTERRGSVTVQAIESEHGGVDLLVRDTGLGMRPEVIERVGEPFMQADTSLARRFEGTGLGLSIVKQIVDLHGGKLAMQSTLGQGTVASIHLPATCTCRQPALAKVSAGES